jgi:hypothetical protein
MSTPLSRFSAKTLPPIPLYIYDNIAFQIMQQRQYISNDIFTKTAQIITTPSGQGGEKHNGTQQ